MSTLPTLDEEAQNRTAAVIALLAECVTTNERSAVTRVALRAEFLWRCHGCKENHYLSSDTCTCGAKRPAHLPG
ncbi:hypothetical protein ACFPN0_14930 [Kitasatospora cinereorecta]